MYLHVFLPLRLSGDIHNHSHYLLIVTSSLLHYCLFCFYFLTTVDRLLCVVFIICTQKCSTVCACNISLRILHIYHVARNSRAYISPRITSITQCIYVARGSLALHRCKVSGITALCVHVYASQTHKPVVCFFFALYFNLFSTPSFVYKAPPPPLPHPGLSPCPPSLIFVFIEWANL